MCPCYLCLAVGVVAFDRHFLACPEAAFLACPEVAFLACPYHPSGSYPSGSYHPLGLPFGHLAFDLALGLPFGHLAFDLAFGLPLGHLAFDLPSFHLDYGHPSAGRSLVHRPSVGTDPTDHYFECWDTVDSAGGAVDTDVGEEDCIAAVEVGKVLALVHILYFLVS